jgi:hypothetical protein
MIILGTATNVITLCYQVRVHWHTGMLFYTWNTKTAIRVWAKLNLTPMYNWRTQNTPNIGSALFRFLVGFHHLACFLFHILTQQWNFFRHFWFNIKLSLFPWLLNNFISLSHQLLLRYNWVEMSFSSCGLSVVTPKFFAITWDFEQFFF